jgi:5-methylcytosine-specific restriction endonuclease McrA
MTLSITTAEKIEKVKAQTKKYDNNELMDYLLDLALDTHSKKQNIVTKKVHVSKNPRTISPTIKREIFKRAGGKCEHPGCQAIHYLEYDHRTPVALGGGNNKENIRLVCKAHNQLYAIEQLGLLPMQKFF